MTTHKQRGGSQIGWVNASWPLASIDVSPGKVTIRSMGQYEFVPSEVTAVEEVGSLPFFTTGIRIHHHKSQYPERVIFYTPGGRDYLLAALRRAGFPVGSPARVVRRGFPLRIPAILGVVLLWNVLFLLDRPDANAKTEALGIYSFLALAGLFALATSLPKSQRLQNLFMRDGRDVGEISSLLRLIQLVTGILLLGLGITQFTR